MSANKFALSLKSPNANRRLRIMIIICFGVFSVLTFRLWSIQIYQEDEYKLKAENNIRRFVPVLSERGKILDQHGQILAEDVSFWKVWLPIKTRGGQRAVTEEIDQALHLLSEILGTPYDILRNRYMRGKRDVHYKHYRIQIADKVPFDKYVALETRRIEFPNEAMITTVRVPQRHYRNNALAAHILGHTREVNAKELQLEYYADYRAGDRIGKTGIEEQYEKQLRGIDGVNLVRVNKHEIQQGSAQEFEPAIPGKNVVLNIDKDLQLAAETILGGSRGVIIASDPRDNAILAMASSPRFDPNLYMRNPNQYYTSDRPLIHRAIYTTYPPGSVFKIFEVVAILEGLKRSPSATVFCPGHFYLPGVSRPWRCHQTYGHGHVDLINAVKLSCDVYFYDVVGTKLGIDRLSQWMSEFGLNDKTGVDLPGEQAKPFPNRATKGFFNRRESTWYPGDSINASIGQGYNDFTTLQIHTALCAVANRGKLIKPRVAKEIQDHHGNVVKRFEPEVYGQIEASTRTWDIVQDSMYQVINDLNRGTGRRIVEKDDPYKMAGKTGTAEIGIIGQTHAWFVLYAPYDDPKIAITVIVERAGHGGEIAAPMAKYLLKVFDGRLSLEDLV